VGRDTLNTLHGARVDQMLTPDGLLKTIIAEAPTTFVRPEDLETPATVQGIVRAKRIVERATDDGSLLSVQEHRELCTCELFDCVADAGAVKLTRGLNWFAQMAGTVMECHAHHLLHGQLRPEHVLLDAEDSPKLLGFEPLSWRQLRRGSSQGAKHALRPVRHLDAPELFGRSHATASELQAADTWALGMVGVAMFVGRPPLVTAHGIEMPIGMQHMPAAMVSLLTTMLSTTPADRPTMPEVAAQAIALAAQADSLATEVQLSTLMENEDRRGGGEMARTDSKLSEMSEAPTRPPSLENMHPSTASSPRLAALQAKLRTLQVLTARPPLDA